MYSLFLKIKQYTLFLLRNNSFCEWFRWNILSQLETKSKRILLLSFEFVCYYFKRNILFVLQRDDVVIVRLLTLVMLGTILKSTRFNHWNICILYYDSSLVIHYTENGSVIGLVESHTNKSYTISGILCPSWR